MKRQNQARIEMLEAYSKLSWTAVISATNTLDSQQIQRVEIYIQPENDAPHLVTPIKDTSFPYFDSLVIDPLRYFREVDDSINALHSHLLTIEVDPNYMGAKKTSSSTWVIGNLGRIGSSSIAVKATDPILGAYTTKALIHNNATWPVGKNMLLPQIHPANFFYPARNKLAWVDPDHKILKAETDLGSILLDSRRRLLISPFKLKSGTCLVAEPPSLNGKGESSPGKFWFIGEVDWPKGVKNNGEAGLDNEWSYRSVAAPLYTAHVDNSCTYDRPSPGLPFRVLRWSRNSVGVYPFENGTAGKESRLEYESQVQILDVLPFGSKIFVLRMTTQLSSTERDVLWLDAYDATVLEQTFSKNPVSQLISVYQPFEGNNNLISRITSGRLWSSGKGLEIFWTKVDLVKPDDIYYVSESTCLFRSAFDSTLVVKSAQVRINQEYNQFADIYIVAIDKVSTSEARIFWANSAGTCGDLSLASTKLDISNPSQIYPANGIQTRDCGTVSVFPFSIPYHFGDMLASVTIGRDAALRNYLRFSGDFPLVTQDPGKSGQPSMENVSRQKGMYRGIVAVRGKSYNLLGQPAVFKRKVE